MSDTRNKFKRPNGPGARKNILDLERGAWGIDGFPVTATAAQLNEAGGGVPFINVQIVNKNGNDLNDGTTINTAKLSPEAALAALNITSSNYGWIWITDGNTYDCELETTYGFGLYAPMANIISNGGDLLTVNDAGEETTIDITCAKFAKLSPDGLVLNLLGAQSNVFLNAKTVQGDMYIEGGLVDSAIGQAASDVHVASTGKFGPTIYNALSLNLTVDAGGTVAGNIQRYVSPGITTNMVYGNQIIKGELNVDNKYTMPTDAPTVDGQTILGNIDGSTYWGAGSSLFNAINYLYFGPGGNDTTGDGTRNKPYETLGKATDEAQNLIDGGALFVQVIGLGTGIDTSNVTITYSGISIYAPTIQHNPSTGDALTVDLTAWGSASFIDVVLASSQVESGAKVLNLVGITGGNNSVTRFEYIGPANGDVYLGNKCEFYSVIISGTCTAAEAGTNVVVQHGIGNITQQTRLNLEGMLFGAGGTQIHGPVNCTNRWRYPMRNPRFLSGDITLDYTMSGYLYINDSSSNYTITLPDSTGQGTPPFVNGYEITFLNLSTGSISFVADGVANLVGATVLDKVAQRANCTLYANDSWEVDLTPTSGGSTEISSITISPTVFDYFNQILTGSPLWISSDAPNTQGSFTGGGPAQDYGTYTFKASAGTYNCAVLYPQGLGNGIMNLIFNGGTPVSIDQYGTNVNQYVSYQFTVTLVDGDNTIQCITNGKNSSSTNYFLTFADNIVLNKI